MWSWLFILSYVTSRHIMLCVTSCHIKSHHVNSHHAMCDITSHVMYDIMSHHVISCYVCHQVTSCHLWHHVTSSHTFIEAANYKLRTPSWSKHYTGYNCTKTKDNKKGRKNGTVLMEGNLKRVRSDRKCDIFIKRRKPVNIKSS